MASKFKITGFARLLLFLLIFAPIAYFGASYINGENGISKLKDTLGSKAKTEVNTGSSNQDELNEAEVTIRELRKENAKLKRKVTELEAQLAQ